LPHVLFWLRNTFVVLVIFSLSLNLMTQYKSLQDAELLGFVAGADKAAFQEIYDRYWREVFLHAYRKVKSKDIAEELIQNLFMSLWERRASGIQDIRSWLFGAVRFAVINYYKAQMVHARYEDYARATAETPQYTTEQWTMLSDLATSIEKGIALLPPKTQEVFKLSRFENRSIKEISKDLGISEKAVEYHITQSLKWMRLYLKDFLTVFLIFESL
jgi:RNA polymerase sigma-70 factor (family 1)